MSIAQYANMADSAACPIVVEDLSQKSFKAYTEMDFKTCKETLEILRKQTEEIKDKPQDTKKQLRVKQNLLLAQFYAQKGQSPHKLLADLQQLATTQNLTPSAAPLVPKPLPPSTTSETDQLNTVLLYNCAAMAYQTQQLGLTLGYLTLALQYLDQFELFLQVKTLFLTLQVLYEMRQSEPSQPIINLLEVKLMDLKALAAQKRQIKDFSESGPETTAKTQEEEQKNYGSEVLDENVVQKNSFCIIIGAYLRKHAVSPKNINLHEFEFLLYTFKALFKIQIKDLQAATELLMKANEHRQGILQDPVQYGSETSKHASQQHMGMLRHAKAQLEHLKGNEFRTVQSLYITEKEANCSTHKSCFQQKTKDVVNDSVIQKCRQMHPQMYFNNLGILHLRFRKFSLAQFQFAKALKFFEVATQTIQNTPQQVWIENFIQPPVTNPHEHVSNMTGQRSVEILFNMGLACYKNGKFEDAFVLFEKVSNSLRSNPQLWYYLALSVLHFNKELMQKDAQQSQETEVIYNKQGYSNCSFEKTLGQGSAKRIQMAAPGDRLQILTTLVQQHEQEYLDRLKSTQTEITKNRLKQISSNMSKAQLKKQEKASQQTWQSTNPPKDSMQLKNAIMYLQNCQVAIQHEISNAQRYTLLYKFLSQQHVQKMQESYNDAHAKIQIDHLSENEAARRTQAEANETQKSQVVFGDDGFMYPKEEQPTGNLLKNFNDDIRKKILLKYATISKNVIFYLCYASLEVNDYAGCIKFGQELLKTYPSLTAKTEFQTKQYIAEAYTMIGNPTKAYQILQEIKETGENEMKAKFGAQGLELPDALSNKTILHMNKIAVKLCANELLSAKELLDELLEIKELKLITSDITSDSLIPSYLIKTLIYFFLKTKNFKMARQLAKNRRFMLDTNYIEPPLSQFAPTRIRAPTQQQCASRSFT